MTAATYANPDLSVQTGVASSHYVIPDQPELVIVHQNVFPRPGEVKGGFQQVSTGLAMEAYNAFADYYSYHQSRRKWQYFGLGSTVRYFRYDLKSSTTILIDEVASESEFDSRYQQVIDDLRSKGREISAEDLIEILRNAKEDPDAPAINIYSLRAMARFLIEYKEFDDPIIGPDPRGTMQVEWHILEDGLLVMAFLGDDCIHCVAQADGLNRSIQVTKHQAAEEFGHLVPLR